MKSIKQASPGSSGKHPMINTSLHDRIAYELAHARKCYYKIKQRYLHLDATRHQYYRKFILDNINGNRQISTLLGSNEPFLVTRLGSVELACIINFLDKKIRGTTQFRDKVKKTMHFNAGFFPCDEDMLDSFCQSMLHNMSEIDLLGVWNNNLEDYLVDKYCRNTVQLVCLSALEPFFVPAPWSAALSHKRVLVIHPFKESILYQYGRRDKLFQNPNMLPEFDLKVIRSVQTIAGNKTSFSTWFDALASMCDEIEKTEFDVAIIGAGAYGLPLAVFVKRLGRQAIHMGGATQLLFGIRGKRWDNREQGQYLYNEYWISPDESETPQGAQLIEGGCYW